jgi:hypothetical protein
MPQGRIRIATFQINFPSASIHRLSSGVFERFNGTPNTTPTFVQDLGFLLPGFWIRSCPLDLLRFFSRRFAANK